MTDTLDARHSTGARTNSSLAMLENNNQFDTVIIGAGIAGLGAAHRLHQAGHSVLVLESSDRVGGAITTHCDGPRVLERGPSSFLSSGDAMLSLVDSLGLSPDILAMPLRDAKRYIYAGDRVCPVPMGPGSFFGTDLLSLKGKLRLMSEPFRKGRTDPEDESLEDFAKRRVGIEAVKRLLHPMICGVYAGDPAQLSAASVAGRFTNLEREYGSILKGFLKSAKKCKASQEKNPKPKAPKTICTIRGGLARIPQTIADRLKDRVLLNAEVMSIARSESTGDYAIELRCGEAPNTQVNARSVICATPVTVASQIIGTLSRKAADDLAKIPANRVCVVSTIYPKSSIPRTLDGFGFLVARDEPLRILGSLWYSSIFPEHADASEVILNQFVGGARHPEYVDLSDDELIALVREDLQRSLNIRQEPSTTYITRWTPAIAQPPVGHPSIVEAVQQELKQFPGLELAGNYLCGISMNDALVSGFKAAESTETYIQSKAA